MRLIIPFFLTFMAQSLLSGLFGQTITPPDLVFLFVMMVVSTNTAFFGLPVAFASGLWLDLVSSGTLGLHAMGTLFAAYAFYRLSKVFHWHEFAGQLLILAGCFLAKWVGILLVATWLGIGAFEIHNVWKILLPEMALTLLVAPLLVGRFTQWTGIINE